MLSRLGISSNTWRTLNLARKSITIRAFSVTRASQKQDNNMKYVVVTGGVVSGLGKGVTASSIGVVLKACGLRVTSIKIGTFYFILFCMFYMCVCN